MVFIDLEKSYNMVPREVPWECLERKEVPMMYIRAIKNMYGNEKIRVRIQAGITEYFPIDIGLHQGFALNSFLFTIVMDEIISGIQDEVP